MWPAGSLNGNVVRNNILARDAADAGQGWLIIVRSAAQGDNLYYTLAQAQQAFAPTLPWMLGLTSGVREVPSSWRRVVSRVCLERLLKVPWQKRSWRTVVVPSPGYELWIC